MSKTAVDLSVSCQNGRSIRKSTMLNGTHPGSRTLFRGDERVIEWSVRIQRPFPPSLSVRPPTIDPPPSAAEGWLTNRGVKNGRRAQSFKGFKGSPKKGDKTQSLSDQKYKTSSLGLKLSPRGRANAACCLNDLGQPIKCTCLNTVLSDQKYKTSSLGLKLSPRGRANAACCLDDLGQPI
ncbi:hypothetical protein J6590_004232 [Homalodisca vitripennis]|nr:hypothetical protein J6590_004232 [Homalodisca vitripennis]